MLVSRCRHYFWIWSFQRRHGAYRVFLRVSWTLQKFSNRPLGLLSTTQTINHLIIRLTFHSAVSARLSQTL